MKKFIVAVMLLCNPCFVGAAVLTFDDMQVGASGLYIPIGYGGLNWGNMIIENTEFVNYGGYMNAGVSSPNIVINAYGERALVTGRLDFMSVYLTAAWNDGLTIEVSAMRNGVVVGLQTVVVDTAGPKLCNFNFMNIDMLSFYSFGGSPNPNFSSGSGTQFALDNFTYNPVPEPGTWLFLGSGLAGLALHRRRR